MSRATEIDRACRKAPPPWLPRLVPTTGPLLRDPRSRDSSQKYWVFKQNSLSGDGYSKLTRDLSSGFILLTSSAGTGFCVSFNYLPTGLANVATSELAETPGIGRRLGIVNLVPGVAFGIGAVAFFKRSVMSSMRMPSKPRRIATMR